MVQERCDFLGEEEWGHGQTSRAKQNAKVWQEHKIERREKVWGRKDENVKFMDSFDPVFFHSSLLSVCAFRFPILCRTLLSKRYENLIMRVKKPIFRTRWTAGAGTVLVFRTLSIAAIRYGALNKIEKKIDVSWATHWDKHILRRFYRRPHCVNFLPFFSKYLSFDVCWAWQQQRQHKKRETRTICWKRSIWWKLFYRRINFSCDRKIIENHAPVTCMGGKLLSMLTWDDVALTISVGEW